MKKTFRISVMLLMLALNSLQANAGQDSTTVSNKYTDISLFENYRLSGYKNPLLWYVREEEKYYFEVRMNFDWSNTASIVIGKTFSRSSKFWITPKAGVLFSCDDKSGYNGLTIEPNIGGKIGKFKYFSMIQYAIGIDSQKDFAYSYIETSVQVAKNIRFNVSGQVFQSMSQNEDVWVDIGPQLLISFGNFYFKPWYTFDPNHINEKVIIGIGYTY